MKKITNTVVMVLSVIFYLLLIALFFEARRMDAAYKMQEQEIYQLTQELDITRDELQKAKWHIEMLNKEREAE